MDVRQADMISHAGGPGKEGLINQHARMWTHVVCRLDAEQLVGRHYGEASCRDYRESLLHQALPHVWTDTTDTAMYEAHFVKHKAARGASKEQLANKFEKGEVHRGKPSGVVYHGTNLQAALQRTNVHDSVSSTLLVD